MILALAEKKETYRLSLMETFKSARLSHLALALAIKRTSRRAKMRTCFRFRYPDTLHRYLATATISLCVCVCVFHKPSAEVHKLHWQFNDDNNDVIFGVLI